MDCFKFKMHQNMVSWGSVLDPTGGAYDDPPDHLVGWRGGHPVTYIPLLLQCVWGAKLGRESLEHFTPWTDPSFSF